MVNIRTLSNLCQLLSHPHRYTPLINSAHLKRNQLAPPVGVVLQKPVSAFLALHPPHHTPSFCLVGDRKGDGFCTVFGDSVVIVLHGVGEVGNHPHQRAMSRCVFDGHLKLSSGSVLIPLQAECGTHNHHRSHVARKAWMHVA